ncbi:hypothetical protein AZE42_07575 [Rhizopogon vesiculosus]|uniref:Uncharacterized protein n=1 Tax=Rhizopogon vesiculosus TaxID=180088 RepID=A0A1J8PGE0_9AGAM|nr:hypothetical protein AZE42_07575 [Rhizopogon vesiculosus]
MSAVYSYETAPLNDNMVERAIMAVKVIVAELRPEFSASRPGFLTCVSRGQGIGRRLLGHSIYAYRTWSDYGDISSCMVVDHLLQLEESDIDLAWQKKALKESASTAFGAGVDTTLRW